jgi:exodeoxyribonuclease VII large subunit
MSYATRGASFGSEISVETVGDLTFRVKHHLEAGFGRVAVEGELSGGKIYSSGHFYGALKDDRAKLNLTIWKSSLTRVKFRMEDGLKVVAYGKLEVYPKNGAYSLIVDRIEPLGQGALDLAFRQICERLRAAGLFDEERKRELPPFPTRVAVVTSKSGAALRDFWRVARERWPLAEILVIDSLVQGESAAESLMDAVRMAQDIDDLSLIVLTRGGGSREDLWPFNDERLAHTIAASRVPVVSAVGHEVDTSVSDLVADLRAATPTHAAAMIFPDLREILQILDGSAQKLRHLALQKIQRTERSLESTDRRLIAAGSRIVDRAAKGVTLSETRLKHALQKKLALVKSDFERQAAVLESLSPLKVLARGYSVTVRADDGKVVRSIADTAPGMPIITELKDGRVRSIVEKVDPEDATAAQ